MRYLRNQTKIRLFGKLDLIVIEEWEHKTKTICDKCSKEI